MLFIYTILYTIVLILVFPSEFLKRPKGLRKTWLREKFGRMDSPERKKGPAIWVHAVSVGEVLASIPFLKKLTEAGDISIILSTITDTGRQIAVEKAPKAVKIVYMPFDLQSILGRAVRSLKPDLFMTMETELWPNLFRTMENSGIPVFIFNGRISDRSFPRYRAIRFFLKRLFGAIEIAAMQTSQDAERIREMGLDAEKIRVTGNFKFDIPETLEAPAWTGLLRGTNLVAGSTHEGEEEIVLDAYQRLLSDFNPLNLVLAPRHPRRFQEVEKLLKARAIPYVKRSDIQPSSSMEIKNTVVLVDVLGELAGLYAAAEICIICGSFVRVGGHNLFEAAYWSKPIVCGPYMNNFPLIDEFARDNAVRVTKGSGLYDIVSGLLNRRDIMDLMGKNARRTFLENGGAVEKAMGVLRPYLYRSGK